MAGPSEGGGMLEVVGAQRRDVLTAGDVAETERDALGNVSEGAGPLDEAGGPAATAKGRPSRPDAPEGGLGDKLSQPAGDRRAAAAMRSRVSADMEVQRPFRNRDTVAGLTPASRATSLMLVRDMPPPRVCRDFVCALLRAQIVLLGTILHAVGTSIS